MDCRIDTIPNRGHPPTILLRRHWREGGRVRRETIANPARRPEWLVEGIRAGVRAKTFLPEGGGRLEIRRSLSHGHAAAILGAMKDLGFKRILSRGDCRSRRLALGSSGTIPAVTTPTPGQRRAFELLGVDLAKMFPAAGRKKTEKGLAGKGKLRFWPVKFSLIASSMLVAHTFRRNAINLAARRRDRTHVRGAA